MTPQYGKAKNGAIAQLGERLPCTQEVGGSIPPGSTNYGGARQELGLSKRRERGHE